MRLDQAAPRGLTAARVVPSLVVEALEEVLPFIPSRQENQFELQLNFGVARSKGTIRITREIFAFPSLAKLMEESMRALGCSKALEPNRLNVIVRRYHRGQGIAWHRDRVDFFEEPVFGCVLRTRATMGLQFWHPDDGSLYKVPERMGVAFLMTGPARNEWQHGIDGIDGDRISVSWRWFKSSAITKMGGIPQAPVSVQPAVVEAKPSELSQHEKSFLKCCKVVREILKLEEKKRDGAKLHANEEHKLNKKMAALKDVTDLLGSLARDSTLRQKNEVVIQAAIEVAPKAQQNIHEVFNDGDGDGTQKVSVQPSSEAAAAGTDAELASTTDASQDEAAELVQSRRRFRPRAGRSGKARARDAEHRPLHQ